MGHTGNGHKGLNWKMESIKDNYEYEKIKIKMKKVQIQKAKTISFLHTWLLSRFPTEGSQKLKGSVVISGI